MYAINNSYLSNIGQWYICIGCSWDWRRSRRSRCSRHGSCHRSRRGRSRHVTLNILGSHTTIWASTTHQLNNNQHITFKTLYSILLLVCQLSSNQDNFKIAILKLLCIMLDIQLRTIFNIFSRAELLTATPEF